MDTHNLAELETRTYRNIYDDGLWDLVLGAFFLSLGIGLLTAASLPAALGGVIAIAVRNSLRKSIIEPRIGYVRLNASRQAKLRWGPCIVAGIAALLILALIWFGGRRLETHVPGILALGLLLTVPVVTAGYLFEIPRMYAYAGVIALAQVSYAAGVAPMWCFLASGSAITISGLFILTRFLRRYPKEGQNA